MLLQLKVKRLEYMSKYKFMKKTVSEGVSNNALFALFRNSDALS